MTRGIEKICTVSGADIRAVLYVMVDVVIDNFAKSTIIRLGDLGSLRVTLSSKDEATEEEVSPAAFPGNGTRGFNPHRKQQTGRLRKRIKNTICK